MAVTPSGLLLTAADGATAETSDPWGEWTGDTADEGHGDDVGDALSAFARHVTAPRRPAVLLVRRGGYACALLGWSAFKDAVLRAQAAAAHHDEQGAAR